MQFLNPNNPSLISVIPEIPVLIPVIPVFIPVIPVIITVLITIMKRILLTGSLFFLVTLVGAQDINKIINATEVERIEKILSSDDMKGRRTFTPGIDKAADFIAEEFQKAGLQPVNGKSYFQEFKMVKTKFISAAGNINGVALDSRGIVALTTQTSLKADQNSGYELVVVGPKDTLFNVVRKLQASKKNCFVVVDTVHRNNLNRLKGSRGMMFAMDFNLIFVLSSDKANSYNVEFTQETTEMPLKNVVGIIPGKSRKNEYVIFSGHYDHLGVGRPNAAGDSIFNGANDDAAGTTAVMMLAHYFAKLKNNERTLVFAAFTAEEVGGFGATYFSRQYQPEQVMAMFNIEMIGTDSKWGPNAAYITGYEKTDMGKILQRNLEGSKFTFYPDPYTKQNLFFRSDNATLARLGVPAHTISTSRMEADSNAVNKEVDKYYHTLDDEIETLNMVSMAEIIKGIAISSATIISGKDTPTRVDPTKL